MARKKRNKNFAMTPELHQSQYEVAQEIGLTNQFNNPEIDALTKTDQGIGQRSQKQNNKNK